MPARSSKLNPDHMLYDPELMHEVEQAVEREHFTVDTVFAMHEAPTPWREFVALVAKSAAPPAAVVPGKDSHS